MSRLNSATLFHAMGFAEPLWITDWNPQCGLIPAEKTVSNVTKLVTSQVETSLPSGVVAVNWDVVKTRPLTMGLTVDEYLERVGGMGRFQWVVVFSVGIILVPVASQSLIMAFLALEPPWRCKHGSSICNFTQEFSRNDPNRDFRCDIPESEWEFTDPYTSIVTEWKLVCSYSSLSWVTTSIMFLGWLIGNIVFGILSDRFGRRKVFFGSSMMVCCFAFVSSFVPYYWIYAICRFFIGSGLGGSVLCLYAIATEYVGPKKRALAGTCTWFFWTLSLILLAPLAYLIWDWRKLSIATSAPGLLIFVFWKLIPESVRWLLTHNQVEQAEATLARVAKFNKKEPLEEHLKLPDDSGKPTEQAGFTDLFRSRSMARKTFICWFSWFVNAQVYYGVSLGSVILGGNRYLNFFLVSLVGIPGNAGAILLMNRFGRKKIVISGLIVGAIANLLVTVVPSDRSNAGYTAARTIFAMCGKLFSLFSFATLYVFSTEIFPTVVRNVGMGTSSAAGRAGSITAPFILWLSTYNPTLPYIIMAVDAFVAGFLCVFLPETNNAPTAETLTDTKQEALPCATDAPKKSERNTDKPRLEVV